MAEPSMLGGVEPHIQQFAEIYDLPYEVARRVVEGELTLEDAVEAQFSEQAMAESPAVQAETVEIPEPPPAPTVVVEPLAAVRSAASPARGGKRVANFDPGFRTAVDRGWLTVQQAVQRGNREAFATRLSRRHGIPMAQALKIADNRVRLAEVLRKKHRARARAKASLLGAGRLLGRPSMSVVARSPTRRLLPLTRRCGSIAQGLKSASSARPGSTENATTPPSLPTATAS